MQRYAFPLFALAMLLLPALPVPDFWITQSNYIGLYALVALGLVLLTGVAGLTSFGQAAFVGVGAYCAAFMAVKLAASPWLALLVGVGLLESFGSYWASAFKEVIVFSAILPVLLWRSLADPHGEEH